MKEIHKEYERSFLLEPTKLIRLLDKIHERLDEHPLATRRDHFEAFLAGNRREEMASIDEVLALENSRKHKIQRLLIVCSAATQGAVRPEHEVQVDFGGLKTRSPNDTSTKKVVAVSIRSEVSGWASRTLSEVEEQVERSWLPYVQSLALLIGLLVVVVIIGLQFLSVRFERPTLDVLRVMWLGDHELDRVQQILKEGHVITDAEMREIATMQLRSILQDQRPERLPEKPRDRQLVLLGAPLLIVLGCIVTLLFSYPRAVFLWGDEVERYTTTLQRRRAAWGIIVSVMVVGVLSKFFFEGVAPWLPRE